MKAVVLLFTLLALTSCASQKKEERVVQEKVAHEKTADGKALGNTIHDLISGSTTLTDLQKTDLQNIIAANKKKADELTEQSFKLRSVLIKELLSGSMSKKQVKQIKKDIKQVEQLRLKNTFETVEKITKIVYKEPQKDQFIPHLINMEKVNR